MSRESQKTEKITRIWWKSITFLLTNSYFSLFFLHQVFSFCKSTELTESTEKSHCHRGHLQKNYRFPCKIRIFTCFFENQDIPSINWWFSWIPWTLNIARRGVSSIHPEKKICCFHGTQFIILYACKFLTATPFESLVLLLFTRQQPSIGMWSRTLNRTPYDLLLLKTLKPPMSHRHTHRHMLSHTQTHAFTRTHQIPVQKCTSNLVYLI